MAKEILFPDLPEEKEFIMDFDLNDRYGEEYVLNHVLNFRPIPVDAEPKWKNKFEVVFPEEINIESFCVQSVSSIGIKDGRWKKISIKFFDLLNEEKKRTSTCLMNYIQWSILKENENKHTTIVIKILDPVGMEVERWIIDSKDFDVNFSNLDYATNEILQHELIIQPIRIRFFN